MRSRSHVSSGGTLQRKRCFLPLESAQRATPDRAPLATPENRPARHPACRRKWGRKWRAWAASWHRPTISKTIHFRPAEGGGRLVCCCPSDVRQGSLETGSLHRSGQDSATVATRSPRRPSQIVIGNAPEPKTQSALDTQGAVRSCPYLSTLQPHVGHVHPPHIPSAIDVGLRSAGMGVRQRGQVVVSGPMPHRPFFFD